MFGAETWTWTKQNNGSRDEFLSTEEKTNRQNVKLKEANLQTAE
jgi:hypothetical protein